MKEATGELSMTAIVVVILGLVAVLAPVIVNTVGNSLKMKAACQASFGCETSNCTSQNTTTCLYIPDDPSNAIGTASASTPGAYQVTCSCSDLGLE